MKERENRMAAYDFLIVGSGLFGAVFAHEAMKRGRSCLVLEKRGHIGGNIYTEKVQSLRILQLQQTCTEYILKCKP